ncbi:MAG TPA: adenylate/guanylate cyclase domain-containing protein [Casimicrobiaceae bacterium]|nr:adenylate/guanylate cyclase domain-containing protein [Casimicrobiaceae bacterium]
MLPTGSVTFLFCDIEGSTTLWEQAPNAMRSLLAWHDGVLRSVIESSGGHIVKTTGDGAYAVFGIAKNAIAACLHVQRKLQEAANEGADATAQAPEPPVTLRVRMGLHSGVAELRDGDYFGAALNRAARIMSVAHGEQVLLSATTAELLRGDLPDGVTLREMGEHRLKGLPNPERLLQIVAPGLRADFPPLVSRAGHSLPAERDAFVGRTDSLAELAKRVRGDARLVSVLGIGGTGKTRLVTRFGWSALDSFPGGVWFCDLSEARTLDGVLHAVAQGLGVPLGSDEPVTRIGNAIAGRRQCLVILDNFEQVARHAEETLGRWLNRASFARFLVTTREVLGLPGEEILALAPLPPQDASALFVRRAEAAKPGFVLSAEDQAAIGPLVKLLDGLPLAIELAAARVRVMPPRTLLVRMSDRFKLLSSAGGRLDRQATLRAVFDWSWDLLSLPEKAALAQLSVFEAGFTLEAAEAVLDLDDCDDAPWAIDILQSLVQKSLVRQVTDDRFDLLVSVQDYAAEHLRTTERYASSGPAAALAAEIRHGAYFASLDEQAAVERASTELDNLVIACHRAAARGDATTAAKTLQAAWSALALRGPFRIGVELASLVQAIPGLETPTAAIVHGVAGAALRLVRKIADARTALERSLEEAREAGDRACETRALLSLGALDIHGGHAQSAREVLELALTAAREQSDLPLESGARNWLGQLEIYLGKPDRALPHFEAALSLARKARDPRREVSALGNLGTIEVSGASKARLYCEAALAMARNNGDRMIEGNTLCNLGLLNYLEGRFEDAEEHLAMGLVVAREIGNVEAEGNVLCNLGMVHDALAELDAAESDYDAALAIAREFELRRLEGQILGYAGVLAARRSKFDVARNRLEAGEALLRAVSDRVSLGLLLCNRCEAEQLSGSPNAATAALAVAEEIAAEVSAGADSELGLALTRLRPRAS